MKPILSLLCLLSFSLVQAQKNDDKVTKEIALPSFSELELRHVFNVTLDQGESQKVIVTGNEKEVEHINVNTSDGVLRITLSDDRELQNSSDLHLKIIVGDLESLNIEGLGNVDCARPLALDELDLKIRGIGNTHLQLDVADLKAHIRAIGNTTLEGEVDQAEIDHKGMGNLKAQDLIVKHLSIVNSGIGNAQVHATESLKIDNGGIGNVSYTGNAEKKEISSSGLGRVDEF